MLYAILCYNQEDVICGWSKAHEDEVMTRLGAVQEKLAREGRLGPVARLMPTTAATTLRKDREPPLVLDGPFAETKEQLLGFYILDCENLGAALEAARELAAATPGGAYELRPVGVFREGALRPCASWPGSMRRSARRGPRPWPPCCATSATSTWRRRPIRRPACAP